MSDIDVKVCVSHTLVFSHSSDIVYSVQSRLCTGVLVSHNCCWQYVSFVCLCACGSIASTWWRKAACCVVLKDFRTIQHTSSTSTQRNTSRSAHT